MRPEVWNLVKDLRERQDAYWAGLDGEDDLGVVVRAHIGIEHELRHFIGVKAPVPEHVDYEHMDYRQTLTLALILGLPKKLQAPLRALGTLRNKFSHRPNMVLKRSDAADIWTKLGRPAQQDMTKGMRQESLVHPSREWQVEKMSPTQLLSVGCAYLHMSVLGEAVAIAAEESRATAKKSR